MASFGMTRELSAIRTASSLQSCGRAPTCTFPQIDAREDAADGITADFHWRCAPRRVSLFQSRDWRTSASCCSR